MLDLAAYLDYKTFLLEWMNRYKARPPYTTMPRGKADPRVLGRLAGHGCLWLVLPQTPPPPSEVDSSTERWWVEHAAFLDEHWFGDVRVMRLVPMLEEVGDYGEPLAILGDAVELLRAPIACKDNMVLVTLPWRARRPLQRDLQVFVQLLAPDGRAVVLRDRRPLSGFAPTSTWQPGTVIVDRYALPLPSTGGPFRLIAGLYAPATGQRLSVGADGGNFVDLGLVPP